MAKFSMKKLAEVDEEIALELADLLTVIDALREAFEYFRKHPDKYEEV